MKNYLLLIAGLMVGLTSCTQKEPDSTTKLGVLTPYATFPEILKGKVKSVKEINYWAVEKDGELVKGDIVTAEERDSLIWSQDFTAYYDEDGIHLRTDYVSFDNMINSWVSEVENKLMVKTTWFYKDTARIYFKLKYDENGNYLTSERFRSEIDTLLNSYTMVTDDNGNITEQKTFNSKGELLNTYRFIYNDKNLTTASSTFNGQDSLLSKSIETYNDHGFYTEAVYTNGIGEIRRTIEMEYTEYDDMGNWLSAKVLDDGKVVIICDRVYEYY